MEKPKNILIVAGEASGDQHAADLVREIKKRSPLIFFWGLGGSRLKEEGVILRADMVSMAVIGFFEVLKHFSALKKIFDDTLAEAEKNKPDLAILVDYPGFNLRLAEELCKRKIPVAYYVSPQIWAWGKDRIKTIKRSVSLMMVLFPFEEKLYKDAGVPVKFVGHPCLDHVKPSAGPEKIRAGLRVSENKILVGLLPGSRTKEIKNLLPIMLDTAEMLSKKFKGNIEFVLPAAPTVSDDLINRIIAGKDIPLKIVRNMTYDAIAASDLCLVCSGTATLETGILATPMAILYKVNLLTWLYVRLLIKIPFIGLVNIVKGRKCVEEFVQFDAKASKIASYAGVMLENREKLSEMRRELSEIKRLLGETGAGSRAADAVLSLLRQTSS